MFQLPSIDLPCDLQDEPAVSRPSEVPSILSSIDLPTDLQDDDDELNSRPSQKPLISISKLTNNNVPNIDLPIDLQGRNADIPQVEKPLISINKLTNNKIPNIDLPMDLQGRNADIPHVEKPLISINKLTNTKIPNIDLPMDLQGRNADIPHVEKPLVNINALTNSKLPNIDLPTDLQANRSDTSTVQKPLISIKNLTSSTPSIMQQQSTPTNSVTALSKLLQDSISGSTQQQPPGHRKNRLSTSQSRDDSLVSSQSSTKVLSPHSRLTVNPDSNYASFSQLPSTPMFYRSGTSLSLYQQSRETHGQEKLYVNSTHYPSTFPESVIGNPVHFAGLLDHCYEDVVVQVDRGLQLIRRIASYLRQVSRASIRFAESLLDDPDFNEPFSDPMRKYESSKLSHYGKDSPTAADIKNNPKPFAPQDVDLCESYLGFCEDLQVATDQYLDMLKEFGENIERDVVNVLVEMVKESELQLKGIRLDEFKSEEKSLRSLRNDIIDLLIKAANEWGKLVTEERSRTNQEHSQSHTTKTNTGIFGMVGKENKDAFKAFSRLDDAIAKYQKEFAQLTSKKHKMLTILESVERLRLEKFRQTMTAYDNHYSELLLLQKSNNDVHSDINSFGSLAARVRSINVDYELEMFGMELINVEPEFELIDIRKPCDKNDLSSGSQWRHSMDNVFLCYGLPTTVQHAFVVHYERENSGEVFTCASGYRSDHDHPDRVNLSEFWVPPSSVVLRIDEFSLGQCPGERYNNPFFQALPPSQQTSQRRGSTSQNELSQISSSSRLSESLSSNHRPLTTIPGASNLDSLDLNNTIPQEYYYVDVITPCNNITPHVNTRGYIPAHLLKPILKREDINLPYLLYTKSIRPHFTSLLIREVAYENYQFWIQAKMFRLTPWQVSQADYKISERENSRITHRRGASTYVSSSSQLLTVDSSKELSHSQKGGHPIQPDSSSNDMTPSAIALNATGSSQFESLNYSQSKLVPTTSFDITSPATQVALQQHQLQAIANNPQYSRDMMIQRAMIIYYTFLCKNAQNQINLPSSMYNDISSVIREQESQPKRLIVFRTMFAVAENEIFTNLLSQDKLGNFKKTTEYADFIANFQPSASALHHHNTYQAVPLQTPTQTPSFGRQQKGL